MVPFSPKSTRKFPGILGLALVRPVFVAGCSVVCARDEQAISTKINSAVALTVIVRGIGFVENLSKTVNLALIVSKTGSKISFLWSGANRSFGQMHGI